jgi:RNA polymerase sigma factor (TIGR02999 family)
MRRLLVDHAQAHNAEMRAGGLQRVELEDHVAVTSERPEQVLALHEALTRLEIEDPRKAKVMELRYFGGFSIEEIADILRVSPRSVKRDWALARIWLLRQMKADSQG